MVANTWTNWYIMLLAIPLSILYISNVICWKTLGQYTIASRHCLMASYAKPSHRSLSCKMALFDSPIFDSNCLVKTPDIRLSNILLHLLRLAVPASSLVQSCFRNIFVFF